MPKILVFHPDLNEAQVTIGYPPIPHLLTKDKILFPIRISHSPHNRDQIPNYGSAAPHQLPYLLYCTKLNL